MSVFINRTVMMSGAEYFSDQFAINALMNSAIPVDRTKAVAEHDSLRKALESAGVKVITVGSPPDLQDGVYTANWALVRNGIALLSRLPNKRSGEEAYASKYLQAQGLKVVTLPESVKSFSGQGDSLVCDDIVFAQSPYRTSKEAHPFLKSALGFRTVVALQTKPSRWLRFGPAKKNSVTGWPDSPTYDLDLALAILKWPSGGQKGLIAWCPQVFTRSSRKILWAFNEVDKIEVSKREAMNAYALNMISTGEVAIMNAGAPKFQAEIEAHGLKTLTLALPELKKGGGSIRCITLTLDNG
jgi:N-dimethylarginine dimethylaminohydrolase